MKSLQATEDALQANDPKAKPITKEDSKKKEPAALAKPNGKLN